MSELTLDQEKINLVLAIFSEERFQDALHSIKALNEEYPNQSILYNIQGACFAGLGSFKDAIESYERAISLNPTYAKA